MKEKNRMLFSSGGKDSFEEKREGHFSLVGGNQEGYAP